MYAKLHFSNTTITSVKKAIVDLMTGTTDKHQLVGTGLDHSRSFITTQYDGAGWRLDYASEDGDIYILSAPCANSAKRKFVKFIGLNIAVGYGFTGTDLSVATAARVMIANSSMLTSNDFELRVSASARRLLITHNIQGFATGHPTYTQGSAGTVAAVFEHTTADSYFTEATEYVPVVLHSGASSSSLVAAATASSTFNNVFSPRHRNITMNAITNVNDVACSFYTRYGSNSAINTLTLNGTGRVAVSEDSTIKALLPFGVNNEANYFRGGSISDLCNVYLGAPNTFRDFIDIRAGVSDTLYSMWCMGYGGHYLAVPKG